MGTPVPPSPTVAHTDAPSRSAALRELDPVHVRFGSGADISRHLAFVRFTPESGQRADVSACPLCAKSGLMHCRDDLRVARFIRSPRRRLPRAERPRSVAFS